jgi:dTDP-N-acetylfucosamine:lipid II N-acetylfucosaminyltransferase
MRILHLVSDEKFINSAKSLFDKAGVKCVWLLGQTNVKVSHISNHDVFLKAFYYSKLYLSIINGEEWDLVFVHGLSPEHQWAIHNFKGNAKLHLLSWGYDIYSLPKMKKYLYSNSTLEILKILKEKEFLNKIKIILFRLFWFKKFGFAHFVSKLSVLSRFSYFSSPIPQDFELLKITYKREIKAEYIRFNYSPFLPNLNYKDHRKEINYLLGHNASFGNNHLDAINFIKKQKPNFEKIYLPLSYGGNDEYRRIIIDKGTKIWGEKFKPIINFLPIKDYQKILDSVNIAVFAHTRQQALGNIISLLYGGSIVFLNPTNRVFDFFNENNVKIFNLNTDNVEEALESYSIQNVIHAREFIDEYFGEKKLLENITKIFEIVSY